MTVNWKTTLSDLIKAAVPTILISVWTYIFWTPIQDGWSKVSNIDAMIPILALTFCAAFDIKVSLGRRGSFAVASSYAGAIIVFLLCLAFAPDAVLTSGLTGIYTLCSFMIMRYGAQIFETKSWHWGDDQRKRTGLAVTSILVHVPEEGSQSFILVKNEDLNEGRGLWVSPGGRWDPSISSPEEQLIEKIATEVNMTADIYQVGTVDIVMPPLDQLRNRDCRWFRAPHLLLYEGLGSTREEFPQHHLDLVYVCTTSGSPAGKVPQYGQNAQLFLPVADCVSDFNSAHNALSKAVEDWHLRTVGQRRPTRDDIADDVVWRLHLVAKALKGAEADGVE